MVLMVRLLSFGISCWSYSSSSRASRQSAKWQGRLFLLLIARLLASTGIAAAPYAATLEVAAVERSTCF